MAKRDCPACEGTGWSPIETDGVRRVTPCTCQEVERAEVLLKQALIPPRYEHCALENFDIRKDKESGQPIPSLREAKFYAQKFVDEYPTDFGLLFVGSTGVGKTHLGVAVLRELMLRKGIECLFYDFLKLLKDIRDSYNPVSETSELTVLQPVLDIEVLLLDEMAASDPTDWVKETLQHIINSRYNQKKVTLITTTLPFGEPLSRRSRAALVRPGDYGARPAGASEILQPSGEPVPDVERSLNQLGPTIRSRLYEMCKVVEMKSDDYRKAIKQAGYKFHVE